MEGGWQIKVFFFLGFRGSNKATHLERTHFDFVQKATRNLCAPIWSLYSHTHTFITIIGDCEQAQIVCAIWSHLVFVHTQLKFVRSDNKDPSLPKNVLAGPIGKDTCHPNIYSIQLN